MPQNITERERMKARIEDIKRLRKKIKDNWALCQLFEGHHKAFEAEYMVAETVHACVMNHKEHDEAFSFRGGGIRSTGSGGLVDNRTAYDRLIDQKYFIEGEHDGKVVIFMTQKLVDYLDEFFERKTK